MAVKGCGGWGWGLRVVSDCAGGRKGLWRGMEGLHRVVEGCRRLQRVVGVEGEVEWVLGGPFFRDTTGPRL